ncbi:MAG TPA: ABC transporter ATP-binding protein [Solirubrobacteraceae bacterium]|nr:ABC transporter ATP-binding protein [Solirubrobacteraceae bacterium]
MGQGFGGRGMVGDRAADFSGSARRLVGQMRPERGKAITALGLACLSVAAMVAGPKILARATNLIFAGFLGRRLPRGISKAQAINILRAHGHGQIADLLNGVNVVPGHGIDFSALAGVLGIALAAYVGSALAAWLQGYLVNDVVQSTMLRMRADVEDKLNRLPLRYFDRQPRGELLSRVTNDLDNVSQTLQQTMSQMITSVLTIVGVLALMFWISPLLALVALITIPFGLLASALIMRRSGRLFTEQWRRTGALNAQVEETFTGHDLMRVFGHTEDAQRAFEQQNQALFEASSGAQFTSGLIMPLMMFLGNLNYVFIAVIGGLRVASGTMSLGDVQAFIQYSRQFTQPLTQMASMVNLLQSGVASAERAFELLDAADEPADVASPLAPPQARGEVAFEHIWFRYEPDKPLIEDLSLTVSPGQTVAIVGPTGAGKTTLVNLVMRFYELDAGRITLDHVDIAKMRRADLRAQIGMVLQDTWLFQGTIRENILYGRPEASEEELIAAAEAAFVDHFVRTLPDGYDTVIDEEGSNLSAGQRQLVTIARAFLAERPLLILDEATSSVDTRTELLVQKAMNSLRTDRTSFVIAHRLSTIRDAGLILMMQNGRIVEAGTHEELLASGGPYSALYHAQFSGETEDEPSPAVSATRAWSAPRRSGRSLDHRAPSPF